MILLSKGLLYHIYTCPLSVQGNAQLFSHCFNRYLECKDSQKCTEMRSKLDQALAFRQLTVDDIIKFLVSENGIRDSPEHRDTFNQLVNNLHGINFFETYRDHVRMGLGETFISRL